VRHVTNSIAAWTEINTEIGGRSDIMKSKGDSSNGKENKYELMQEILDTQSIEIDLKK
jgi:hypothetical protein